MPSPNEDINDIIASAVNARVETAVLEALSSDDTMRVFVAAALNQKVSTTGYSRDETTLLNRLLKNTIEEQTKAVVAEEVAGHADVIRKEVRAALKKSIGVITDSLVDGFVANASGRYPSIKVEFRGRDD